MKMTKFNSIMMILLMFGINFSCTGKKAEKSNAADEGLIEITQEQFKSSKMALGMPGQQTFLDKITCKGFIYAPANAMSKVCPSIPGKVNTIHNKIGDFVKAGQVIATISGNEFMQLQQNFAEAAASYTKAKLDYERANALWAEKIGAQKDYLAAKSIYLSSQASYQSLKSRIAALNLNPSRIENGKMFTSFPVVAPISGHVTKINAVIGQFLSVENDVLEIVNISSLQLQLQVYEADVRRLKVGQPVQFGSANNPNRLQQARLVNIGKTVNPETKTIDCIASIDKSGGVALINDSYVEAGIIVATKKGVALPVTAVQKQDNNYFVYVVDKMKGSSYMLKKTQVSVGNMDKDYIEITSSLPQKDVVIRGIDTL